LAVDGKEILMHSGKESISGATQPQLADNLREWAEISGISIGAKDGGPYPTLEQLAQFIELASSSRPPQVRTPSDEEIHRQIYLAVLSCPHAIDEKKVVLEFDPRQPGNNALDQVWLRSTAMIKRLTSHQTIEPEGDRPTPKELTNRDELLEDQASAPYGHERLRG
jgi:hypothetical protein